ncbi:hypothetical protein MASR1M90_19850 [Desulfovibrionales bacterium]
MSFDTQLTVLIVEDILSARETVMNLLRVMGFSNFVEAENGEVALKKLQDHDIGLIISDWNMPFMNGMALLKAVRGHDAYRYVPFILLTSKSEMDDVALASEKGVSGYLVKPVTIRSLAETLHKVFEQSKEKEFDLLKADIARLVDAKQFSNALEALAIFEGQYPYYALRVHYERTKVLLAAGELELAETLVNTILSTQPLFAQGWAVKARIFLEQKKWENALKAIEKALAISCYNQDFYVLQGKTHLFRGDHHAARTSFMTALNVDAENNQVKQDVWNAYVDLDLVDEVQKDFGPYLFSALTCDTLNNMAVAYRRKGDLGLALKIYKEALNKEPDNPKILFNMAVAYTNCHEYVKARDLLVHAVEKNPDFTNAKTLLDKISNIIRRSFAN